MQPRSAGLWRKEWILRRSEGFSPSGFNPRLTGMQPRSAGLLGREN